MLNRLQKYRADKEQGFTLMELMVVILIIGILAAIAIPAFLNQRKSANDAALQSDLYNTSIVVTSEGEDKLKLGELEPSLTAGVLSKGSKWGKNNEKNILLSNGSKIKVSGNPNAYCITGWNSGSHHDEEPMNWDSVKGGLLDDGVLHPGGACTSGDTTAPAPGGDGEGEEVAIGAEWVEDHGTVGYWNPDGSEGSTGFTLRFNHKTGEGQFIPDDPNVKFNSLRGMAFFDEVDKVGGNGVLLHFEPAGENRIALTSQSMTVWKGWMDDPQLEQPNFYIEIAYTNPEIDVDHDPYYYTGEPWFDDRQNQPFPEPEANDSANYNSNDAILDREIKVKDSISDNPYYGKAYLFDDGYVKLEFNDTELKGSLEIERSGAINDTHKEIGEYKGSIGVNGGMSGYQLNNTGDMSGMDFYDLTILFGDNKFKQPEPEPEEEEPTEEAAPVLNSDASNYNIGEAIIDTHFYLGDETGKAYLFDNGYIKLVFDSTDLNRNIEVGSARVQTRDPDKFTGNFSGEIGVHNGVGGFMLNDHTGIEAGNIEMMQIF